MPTRLRRLFASLDLEERILNGAVIFALISVFSPWFSGEWLGEETVSYSGFQFFTAFIGTLIFALNLGVLALTVLPAFNVAVFARKKQKELVRLFLASQATVLSLAALSVLTIVTHDYTRMEIRFGIYFTFIGSLVATFYAFWKYQEQRRLEPQSHFHHPDDMVQPEHPSALPDLPPPPPPPAPPKPEEHHIVP